MAAITKALCLPLASCAACLAAVSAAAAAEPVRVATFNVSLYGKKAGEVLARISRGDDRQAQCVAEIIQRARPEILLLNEVDYDAGGDLVNSLCEKYLAVGQHASGSPDGAATPIEYAHRYFAPVNTGRHAGFDLDRNGAVDADPASRDYSGDCWGFGRYEGQYGMVVLSQHPIDVDAVRTFRDFRWRDMPGALLPDDSAKAGAGDWYDAAAVAQFPLSSKSHWDVPIDVRGRRLHVLASHPTPPVFDGEEDRNGRRNQDEIRFWVDYISPMKSPAPSPRRGGLGRGDEAGTRGNTPPLSPPRRGEGDESYIYDDNGEPGGLSARESFVILGDLNGDPHDGDGQAGISRLLASPRLLKYSPPESPGAVEQARLQGPPNDRHRGEARHDTIDVFDGDGPGNLRLDYVLPSADLQVVASGVFWPQTTDPLFKLAGVEPFPASDHRLVWIDIAF